MSEARPTRGPDTSLVHAPSFRLNSFLFGGFLLLSVLLWMDMPERYPVHFDLTGHPTRWSEQGVGMWILLVSICSISFLKLHLFQRFLVIDPDSTLLNVPHKELFRKLPRERKIPVIRRMNRMLGLVNTGMLLTFIAILFLIFHSAHNPESGAARVANLSLLTIIVLVVVAPLAELVAVGRMIRRKLREEGLLEVGRA